MTSKNSFLNMLKEDRKRRLWSIALSILANFFALPVFAALCMSIYDQRLVEGMTTLSDARDAFVNMVVSAGNIPVLLIAGGLALINGLNGMAYLHSRTKTDLYYGLPVKREVIFNAAYLNGILFFAIPYVIFMGATAGFGFARGYFLPTAILPVLFGILYVLIMYISMYTLVVLAGVISGNTIVSIFMSVLMMFYVPLCYLTVMGYSSTFFVNYYHMDNDSWRFLSPAMAYIWFTMKKIDNMVSIADPELLKLAVSAMIVMAVLAVLVYFLAVVLIKKRPAESATKAIAFRGLKPVIKILLMIVGTMLFALLMAEVSSGERFGWIVFGFIAGVVLIQAVCEIVFEFDFKACIKHPVSFIIGSIITAAAISVFLFDLYGYDSYIPNESEIRTSAVCCYNLQTGIEYSDIDSMLYLSPDEYRLKHMYLENAEDVTAIARSGVEFSDRIHADRLKFINRSDSVDEALEEDNFRQTSFVIAFRLKNGCTAYRSYYVDLSDPSLMKSVGNILETKEYKEGVFDVLDIKKEDMVQMHVTTGLGYKKLSLDDDEKEKFCDYYRLDLMEQDFDSMKNEYPICMVTATDTPKKNWMYEGHESRFFIYPSYKRCMEFLKDKDIEIEPDFSKISSVSISRYDEDNWYNADFSEREQINEILSLCVPSTFYYFNSGLNTDADEDIESLNISVYCDGDDYSDYTDGYVFATDSIPKYVTESMKKMD
ncbi:MAG: ABC transporter permease [Lachnospiraceae bacterium]|nr:ABC transporter permease [Lachnospiraceae bacterium]